MQDAFVIAVEQQVQYLNSDWSIFQCAELHLVECGERTELEPPISTDHCPRLWGTFADPEDCGVFWKCQDGKVGIPVPDWSKLIT